MTGRTERHAALSSLLVGGWLAAVLVGLGALLVYGNTPGAAGVAPGSWPADAGIARSDDRPTLLMFAHPRCPCTHASLGELARLIAEVGPAAVDARVVLLRPAGHASDDEWIDTPIRRAAEGLSDLRLTDDPGGRLARRFGAETSGHVVLYDRAGRLVFSGGVTPSRAHEGDNAGRASITRFLHEGAPAAPRTAVFGCPLRATPASDGEACCPGP